MTSAVYLSAVTIAERLGLSRSAAYALVRRLPHIKLGRLVRVAEADLAAYLAANTVRPAAESIPTEVERRRRAWELERLTTPPRSTAKPAPLRSDLPRVPLTRPRELAD